MTTPFSIYTTQQIRQLEKLAASNELMKRAGIAAFHFLQQRFPLVKTIAIFCGSGDNGGDGYVLAKLAHEAGLNVQVWQVGKAVPASETAKLAYQACVNAHVPITAFHQTVDLPIVDVIVDAICGIGLENQLREEVLIAIKKIEALKIPVLALDVPTGVHADTGNILGAALPATATLTFIGLKLGLLTGKGRAYAGEVVCEDLQLPPSLFAGFTPAAEKISLDTYRHYLKPRTRDWHKGLSGHVLIIGGDVGFLGAPCMAGMAALRVGAGLVSIATHPQHAALISASYPALMSHGVSTPEELTALLGKATIIVVGPGLNLSDWGKSLWKAISSSSLPLLVDADGLNCLALSPMKKNNWILTPHPAEAGRLLQWTTQEVQQDRLKALQTIQAAYGGTVVLKGAGTLVLGENDIPALCDRGNPGMATAGMGDVLSGVIAGLAAQGVPLKEAAKLGTEWHAMAGDLAAEMGGERGLIAPDLMPYLRCVVNMGEK